MSMCPVCGKPITGDDPLFLFHNTKSDSDVFICSTCEKKIQIIMESTNPSEVKNSINYIYSYSKTVKDTELKEHLTHLVENNAGVVDDLAEEKRQKGIPNANYYEESHSENDIYTDGWISGLKLFSWISFLAIIVVGTIIASGYFRYNLGTGIIIILLSFVVAFLLLAVLMVFLNMALDIRHIRYSTGKNKKK